MVAGAPHCPFTCFKGRSLPPPGQTKTTPHSNKEVSPPPLTSLLVPQAFAVRAQVKSVKWEATAPCLELL